MIPYAAWLCWAIPLIGSVLTPVFAKISPRVRDYAAVVFGALAMIMAISMIPDIVAGQVVTLDGIPHEIPYDWVVPWMPTIGLNVGVLIDPLSVLLANVAADIGFLILLYSIGYMHGDPDKTRYWFFMQFFVGSMVLLVMADNFLLMFIGWEGVGLCSYALIGFWHKKTTPSPVPGYASEGDYNAHAGLKAFIVTRAGDITLLIAILIIFVTAGTFNYIELQSDFAWMSILSGMGLSLIVPLLLLGGPIGKSAQFPLHVWLPEAMAGPTTVSALIHAAAMVKAGVYLVARSLPIFHEAFITHGYPELYTFFQVVSWIGIFTAFMAATMGMVAKEIKKVLAFSTISQLGYMFCALGIGGMAVEFGAGFTAGVFHLAAHAIFKALLFLAAGCVLHATDTKDMFEMGGIRKEMPWTYRTMLVGALSLSGVPFLFAGGWSKEAILVAALETDQILLFAVAALTAAITAFYSLRMLGITFFGPKSDFLKKREAEGKHVHEAPLNMLVPLLVLAGFTILIGVLSIPDFFGLFGFEGALHTYFGAILGHGPATLTAPILNPSVQIALGTSLLMLAIGFAPALILYIRKDGKTAKPTIKPIYQFLRNRWYINEAYRRVFVRGAVKLGSGLYKYVETRGIDRFNYAVAGAAKRVSNWLYRYPEMKGLEGFNRGVAKAFSSFGKRFRRLQTGVLSYNMIGVLAGMIAIVSILVLYFLVIAP
ncbi:MAG: NADH-quinone oxidoreductase subunit L [Promethearchaeota archaeon]